MPLLKAEPAGAVRSLEELFAIASTMDHEAATRYAEIAERMRREGNPALAEVFERLSADERGHLDNVVHWSQKTKGKDPDPALIRWQLPETFDDEGAATTDPRLLSAYRALSMAVRNEERAFAFWTYVAAHAELAEIRQAAETMAHEELEHVSTLRRERRNAFHAQREQAVSGAQQSEGDAARLESRLADLLKSMAAQASHSEERMRLQNFAEEARRHAEELERFSLPIPGPAAMRAALDDPLALAELLTDRYLAAGDSLQDEKELEQVQRLAGRAIARLAWLRADLPELRRD